MTNEHVAEQFKAYVAHKLPDATNIVIGFILPVFGGASRETFSIELNYSLNDEQVSRRVILRREFASGIVESQTRTEWEAYKAFYGTDVPVPELLWLEEDSKILARAFLPGGSIELSRLQGAMAASWDTIPAMFFATAYAPLIEHGLGSLAGDDSFSHLERYTDDYLTEYLNATHQVVAGPEPLVAYLLDVEQEIRSVRLIFSAKQANLPADSIRDRLALTFAT